MPESDVMPPRDRLTTALPLRIRGRIVLIFSLVGVAAAFFAWRIMRPPPEQLARAARLAAYRGDLSQSDRLLHEALERAPRSPEVLVAAGELAARRGDAPLALQYYERVPHDGSSHATVGAGAAGDLLLELNRFEAAEQQFRRILAVTPEHVMANRRLASLLFMAGRRRESVAFLLELLRSGEIEFEELALLGNLDLIFDDAGLLERRRQAAPEESSPQLASARLALQKSRLGTAAELLTTMCERFPELWEARINLGKVLVDVGTVAEFLKWHEQVPRDLDQNADLWVICGQFAQRQAEPDVALRCYWEALRRDPNIWQANYQIAWLLKSRDDSRAAAFLDRSEQLKMLAEVLEKLLRQGPSLDLASTAANLTESLGRPWEARAWRRIAAKAQAEQAGGAPVAAPGEAPLAADTPFYVASANPALAVDFSSLPLPRWKPSHAPENDSPSALDRQMGCRRRVQFADRAPAAGIDFTYDNGDDPKVPGMRTWQSFGGGVAVLDVDADGWPDLFFTQGGDLPIEPGRPQPNDRLFRNRGDGRYADITAHALLTDSGYGQGAAAGDYDNDGFADLYVANIGRNRLFHNNGDGTFKDVTGAAGISGQGWTASCFFADLNADGFADIYDVTYLAGRMPFEHFCEDPAIHEFRVCPPTLFDAEPDRLYLNLGNGAFEDVTAGAGINVPGGKGLGAVAADFELAGRLNLFVANDTTVNFYFVNETSANGAAPRFSDQAVVRGCAYNAVGKSQASMGVAVADADGDGRLDLYVSNFYNEYNVLYRQCPGGQFVDGASAAGLKVPSEGRLGFGTQFLDADLDGWPDLVVANGHVDDYSQKGIAYRMRPQFYCNRGEGRFSEVPSTELGDYFERPLLGRGLARLDWNRDGREDFAVSHLDSPAALVTNQSPATGHFLSLQLRGVRSNRDAVGAVAWVTVAGRARMQQITAGDGYYACNQKQLIFGLGDAGVIDELRVRWPSGLEQRFIGIPADRELILVEGRRQLCGLPRHDALP